MSTEDISTPGGYSWCTNLHLRRYRIQQRHEVTRRITQSALQMPQGIRFPRKPEKFRFFQTQIGYLGYVVDSQGIRLDPEKVKTIAAISPPTIVSELRSYLGAINIYGRFVRNLQELRNPMDQLLKKESKWQWTPQCQEAYDKFMKTHQSNLLLTHYDIKLPIIVAAVSARLSFTKMKAIQHASRTLAIADLHYGQPEKVGLGLIYAVTKFHKYLLGRHFTLLTDHKPLLSFSGSKKGIPLHTASRLQRWALTMLYYYEIQYDVSTNDFGCADVLSRLINRTNQPEEEYVIAAVNLEKDLSSILSDAAEKFPVSFAALRKATPNYF